MIKNSFNNAVNDAILEMVDAKVKQRPLPGGPTLDDFERSLD